MKMKKMLSAVAAVAAAGVVATTASANWKTPKGELAGGLNVGTGNWLLPIFCNVESPDIPLTDYNLDLSKIGYIVIDFEVGDDDPDNRGMMYNGMFGGAVGASIHATTIPGKPKTESDPEQHEKWGWYNWDNGGKQNFWGVVDLEAKNTDAYDIDGNLMEGMEDNGIVTADLEGQGNYLSTVSSYHYRIKAPFANPVADGVCAAEDITDIRVYIQGWSGCWSMADFTVTRCALLDTDGKAMIAFDGLGNKVDTNANDEVEPVKPVKPEEGEETSAEESTPAAESSTPAADNSTPASDNSTPAASTPAASTPATSGSSSSSSSGLPVPAIIGIAAGVVAVIAVVIVVAKKKKG